MTNDIETYLKELQTALASTGADPALVQDALFDAEEYLQAAMAVGGKAGRGTATYEARFATAVQGYGTPEEVAGAYLGEAHAHIGAPAATPAATTAPAYETPPTPADQTIPPVEVDIGAEAGAGARTGTEPAVPAPPLAEAPPLSEAMAEAPAWAETGAAAEAAVVAEGQGAGAPPSASSGPGGAAAPAAAAGAGTGAVPSAAPSAPGQQYAPGQQHGQAPGQSPGAVPAGVAAGMAASTSGPVSPAATSVWQDIFGVFVDPAVWKSLLYMIISLVTGIVYFTIVVTGISTAAGMIVMIIGIPLLLAVLGLVRAMSLFEGRIVEGLLGTRMPRRPRSEPPNVGFFQRIGFWLKDARTWASMVYMVLMLPLGIVYFTIAVTGLSVGIGMIAAPIWGWFGEHDVIVNGVHYDWWFPAWGIPLSVIGGAIVLVGVFHLIKWIGRGHAAFAKAMLVRLP